MIIIFNFVQIVHNNNETTKAKYYASCFKKEKYYRNYIVFCRMVFKYFSVFFFSFKKYALKNIVIHVMCIFTKNMTHKEKEWNEYLFLQNN